MTDDGLTFRASIRTGGGTIVYRETANRAEVLDWIRTHAAAGGLLIGVGMEATGTAIPPMLLALAFGQQQLDTSKGEH